jgi:hypothetical protein
LNHISASFLALSLDAEVPTPKVAQQLYPISSDLWRVSTTGEAKEFIPRGPNRGICLSVYFVKILTGSFFVVGKNGKR